jgi:hypothetical protein
LSPAEAAKAASSSKWGGGGGGATSEADLEAQLAAELSALLSAGEGEGNGNAPAKPSALPSAPAGAATAGSADPAAGLAAVPPAVSDRALHCVNSAVVAAGFARSLFIRTAGEMAAVFPAPPDATGNDATSGDAARSARSASASRRGVAALPESSDDPADHPDLAIPPCDRLLSGPLHSLRAAVVSLGRSGGLADAAASTCAGALGHRGLVMLDGVLQRWK